MMAEPDARSLTPVPTTAREVDGKLDRTTLIHLHRLLARTRMRVVPDDSKFPRYNSFGVTPKDVQQGRGKHAMAIRLLVTELDEAVSAGVDVEAR